MDEDNMVRIEGVSKTFTLSSGSSSLKSTFTSLLKIKKPHSKNNLLVLRDINISVKKGEFFGIVGRNGSGKSTLLKIIAGIYQPTHGTVKLRGKLVPFIELGVGFNPELTGRENVYLNGALLGFSVKEIDAKYKEIVEFAELEKFMTQKLKNYSSGMQVRLAFSLAIRADADILLIDEVLAVGDANFQRKCFNYFKQLKRENKTVVFVSHDMDAVREYCDRALLIEESEVRLVGSTDKVAKEYAQLFREDYASAIEETESSRWGNKGGEILEPTAVIDDKNITIQHSVINNREIEGAIVGIRIVNAEGKPIMGTNTNIRKVKLNSTMGFKYKAEWVIPNILSDGRYTLDIGLLEEQGLSTCDWWESCLSFRVIKDERVPYDISPVIEFKIFGDKRNA